MRSALRARRKPPFCLKPVAWPVSASNFWYSSTEYFEQLRDVRAGAQLSDKSCRVKGGAAGQLVALDQQHVPRAGPGQMIGGGAADDASSDDDVLGARKEACSCLGPVANGQRSNSAIAAAKRFRFLGCKRQNRTRSTNGSGNHAPHGLSQRRDGLSSRDRRATGMHRVGCQNTGSSRKFSCASSSWQLAASPPRSKSAELKPA